MSSESRKHPRFDSQLRATAVFNEDQRYPCLIINYSHSGIRLRWNHGSLPADTSEFILEIQLHSLVKLKCEFVFQKNDIIGLRIPNPNSKLFISIQEHVQQQRANVGLSQEQRHQFRQIVEVETQKAIPRLPQAWLPMYCELALNQADVARSTSEQQAWLSLEKQVRATFSEFSAHYSQLVQHQLQRWLAGESKLTEDTEEYEGAIALSLVHQSDFEDWLLARVAASHLQSLLNKENFELRQLLDTLSTAAPANCFNPIGPNTVTEAFRDCIDTLGLPHKARELAFECFEKTAFGILKSTYQTLISKIDIPITFRYRRAQGVEHDAKTAAKQSSFSHEATHSPSATDGTDSDVQNLKKNYEHHRDQARQAYSNVQHLLSLRSSNAPTSSSEPALPEAEEKQVLAIVENLAQETELGSADILAQVEAQLATQKISLSNENRQAISTLEEVARNLLDNPGLPEFVKPAIKKITWPLFQLMLQDPSLLFNPEHPGRQTLNLMGRLGRVTVSGHNRIKDILLESVQPIAEEKNPTAASFNELIDNLQIMIGTAERKIDQKIERVAQSAEGEYRLYMARKRINNLLGQDLSERRLPVCVVEWLQDGWQQMLSLLLLREGSDSRRFRGAVKLYRQILVLFHPNNANNSKLLEKIPPLLELARSELDHLNGSLPEHQQWYLQIMREAKTYLQEGSMINSVEMPTYIEPQEEPPRTHKGAKRVRALRKGDLVQDQNNLVMTLAWISNDSGRYVLVNNTGARVAQYVFNELADAMLDGQIRRMYEEEESPVDQSIDALIQNIYYDLSRQANADPLTGLLNRQHALLLLEEHVLKSQQKRPPQTLCLLDIDQFRLLNKNYGEDVADQCLIQVANILREHHPDALIARVGSNEFIVLLEGYDIEQAEAAAKLLISSAETFVLKESSTQLKLRLSAGVATLSADTASAADLIEQTELACKSAKEKGGARVASYQFDNEKQERHKQFMIWGERLSHALENNRLRILCVPIEPLHERSRVHNAYEILIAIAEPDSVQNSSLCTTVAVDNVATSEKLTIAPIEVLQAAENYNRRFLLDTWLINTVVTWLRDHPEQSSDSDRFILRLSSHSIQDETLLEYLTVQSQEYEVPLKKLYFDINETSAIRDLHEAAEFMYDVRKLGPRFVLSEFGTGPSSYQYLKILPVDIVKIDHHFIDGLSSSSADYALINSIQEIAHFMAKKTIAEYSDESTASDILRGIGIDYMIQSTDKALPLGNQAQTL
ncbi:MAG: DUF1631 family protein [Oleibacter sp.]|nr:DUF1631 family protein [Thalassolituus sp.]